MSCFRSDYVKLFDPRLRAPLIQANDSSVRDIWEKAGGEVLSATHFYAQFLVKISIPIDYITLISRANHNY